MYGLESEIHPISDYNNHQLPKVKLVSLFLLNSGASQDYFLLEDDFLRAGRKGEACGASYIALLHYPVTHTWFFKNRLYGLWGWFIFLSI